MTVVQTSAGVLKWHIDGLTSQCHLLGTCEPFMQDALRQFVRPGAVVYDVGAHVGFHSLYSALLVGPLGRVFAFEPDPEAIASLRREISANPELRIEIIECALSDSIGTLQLNTSIESSQSRISASGGIRVESKTIDSLVLGDFLPPPNVIKIDVEGHEKHVLKGAVEALRKYKPVVLCDFHDGSTLREVSECVSELGYRVLLGPPITACPEGACDPPRPS